YTVRWRTWLCALEHAVCMGCGLRTEEQGGSMSAKPFQDLDALVARVAKAQRRFASYPGGGGNTIFCRGARAASGGRFPRAGRGGEEPGGGRGEKKVI